MDTRLYIIAASSEGPCKIGYSRNPEQRLRQLQTGYPKPLQIRFEQSYELQRARLMERLIHKTLKRQRSYGEWFDISVNDAIAELEFHLIRYGDEANLRNYL